MQKISGSSFLIYFSESLFFLTIEKRESVSGVIKENKKRYHKFIHNCERPIHTIWLLHTIQTPIHSTLVCDCLQSSLRRFGLCYQMPNHWLVQLNRVQVSNFEPFSDIWATISLSLIITLIWPGSLLLESWFICSHIEKLPNPWHVPYLSTILQNSSLYALTCIHAFKPLTFQDEIFIFQDLGSKMSIHSQTGYSTKYYKVNMYTHYAYLSTWGNLYGFFEVEGSSWNTDNKSI